MNYKFYIMSGAGNIFVVYDNRNTQFNILQLSKILLNLKNYIIEQFKIEIEGFIALKNNVHNDFEVDFLNPDGTSGMMCGNGGRCALKFAKFLNISNKNLLTFNMAGNEYKGYFNNKKVYLELEPPKFIEYQKKIILNDIEFIGDYINVGSDHYCVNLDSVNDRKFLNKILLRHAKDIRFHNEFERGVNVNFYYIKNNKVYLSTFERGVEGITGACGTGAISTAISVAKNYKLNFPITIIPPSRQKLIVNLHNNLNDINKIELIGNAKILFDFELYIGDL